MDIIFTPLLKSHFPLLFKWLETPHVKAWWDKNIQWTSELIREKYGTYVNGYKIEDGISKPLNAYIICVDNTPIGYIQIYNAHDFEWSKPLTGFPSKLAAFDIFIGEESYLKQSVGSKAIIQFFTEYAYSYSHIFVNPDKMNIAAIHCYEKAGFKRINNQPDTNEIWMIREQSRRSPPLQIIQELIQKRYTNAKAVFWAGSVSQNQATHSSDLDLIIIYDTLPNAYREAFIYEGWPVDAFVHDLDTLRYFFEESRTGNGISGLLSMILHGQEITKPSPFSEKIKSMAQDMLIKGPVTWDKNQIDKERFLITDVLDDIKHSVSRSEQIASAAWLFEALGQFYFRSQQKWCASGKSIIRYFKNENPNLALEFSESFDSLFQTGNVFNVELLVKKILAPYGGLFWDGFTSEASKKYKLQGSEKTTNHLTMNNIPENNKNRPVIILLNGPSSSGKSTLVKILQSKLPAPFLHIGIDKMIAMMPYSINNWEGSESEQGFWWKESFDADGQKIFEIQLGPYAKRIVTTYKDVVITLANNGHNVIVDEVAFGNEEINAWRKKLRDFNTLYIGIHCSLPILEKREKLRGDRIIGSARHQYYTVHQDVQYDLCIDTEHQSLENCAAKIIKLVNDSLRG